MISYTEALEIIKGLKYNLSAEKVPLLKALNRVNASEIKTKVAIPNFNNSAMDGYGLNSQATLKASVEEPLYLPISRIIAAGEHSQNLDLEFQTAIEIMTGGMLPDLIDTVIPVEQAHIITQNNYNYLEITNPIEPLENVRLKGSDVALNETILNSNLVISPADIMLLASSGVAEVLVYSKIKIDLIATGNEVLEDYTQSLKPGLIYNANTPLLLALNELIGITETKYLGVVRDDVNQFKNKLISSQANIIITTGAVSRGRWDFIPQALEELGAEILFHGVKIRPGKPILLARLKTGQYFFGLPGNPVSSFVGFRFFVLPLILKILSLKSEEPNGAILLNSYQLKSGLQYFLKAVVQEQNGRSYLTILDHQESYKIKSLALSNAFCIVTEGDFELQKGSLVNWVGLTPIFKV